MALDDTTYHAKANATLNTLLDVIDEALGDEVDVEMQQGVLTLQFEDGRQYVINKQAPMKQIWLSSPVSGASHYEFDEAGGRWTSTRGGGDMMGLLADELEQATGTRPDLG